MQKIVTDVTYIKHNCKWYYLAGYLDLFNNEILEWELSDTFDNFLVMKPAERLPVSYTHLDLTSRKTADTLPDRRAECGRAGAPARRARAPTESSLLKTGA